MRLTLSPLDLAVCVRLYKIPGLTASEITVQIPDVLPRNVRGSCLQLRKLKFVRRGSPYKRNRTPKEVHPLYLTKKGSKVLLQHLKDIFLIDALERNANAA